MSPYLSPGLYVRETDFSFYVKQISTSAAGFVGVARKGPINEVQLVTSWEQFVRKYGAYTADGYLAYAARAFFDNGGNILYVNRVAHHTDITDRATLTAVKATRTLKDRSGVKASKTTGAPGTDAILWTAMESGVAGNTITVTIVVAGNSTPLSVAVAGTDITLNAATDASGVCISTADEVVDAVNAHAEASLLVLASSEDSGVVSAVAQTGLEGGVDAEDTLEVNAINEGTWGDGLTVAVSDGTLNPTTEFNLTVKDNGQVVEIFRDLSMDEASANFVELKVNEKSEYVTVAAAGSTTPAPGDRPELGEFGLSGGDDGLTGMADADYAGDASNHTGLYAFDEIDAVNMLAVPGVTSAPVIHAGIAYCEARQDCILVAECPVSLDPLEAVDFRKGQGGYTHAAFNSSYAALYYPWLEISDPLTSQRKLVPPSGAVCGCYARSDQKTRVWYAPAGIDRGRVFNVLGLGYKTSRAERDVLYPEGVNVIASFPDSGVNVWGQKTLQAQPSALDRVNVRRLMMYIEEAVAESSRFVVFEPNNPQTWRALARLINPFLQTIKENGGLYEYAVQCDEETSTPAHIDRNELVCRVFVKPVKTAEFVELNFILVSTGGSFSEILNVA